MRKAWTWLAGGLGLAALARTRARRRARRTGEIDYAEGLRRKLAERRSEGSDTQAAAPAAVEEPADLPAGSADLEARRASVHARAQEAIDLMREVDPDPDPGPEDAPGAGGGTAA